MSPRHIRFQIPLVRTYARRAPQIDLPRRRTALQTSEHRPNDRDQTKIISLSEHWTVRSRDHAPGHLQVVLRLTYNSIPDRESHLSVGPPTGGPVPPFPPRAVSHAFLPIRLLIRRYLDATRPDARTRVRPVTEQVGGWLSVDHLDPQRCQIGSMQYGKRLWQSALK